MFVSIKKRSIIIGIILVLTVTCVCVMVSVASSTTASVPKIGKTIVIDAGHGGIDGGVVGVNTKTKESEINLCIAKSLKHFLLQKGYDVVMTRTNMDGLYGMASKNKKARDMEERKRIINEAKPDLVVSIHQNFFPRENSRGAQVFYAPKSENGLNIATKMQQILNLNLEASSRSAAVGDYFILQCSPYPSMLVECGFLSNPVDEKLLVSAVYQEKIAYSIFTGIANILAE